MEEKLKTTLLKNDKSTFLIDLIKHNNGTLYVEILQTTPTKKNKPEVNKIKINPSVLAEIIEVLINYKKSLPKDKTNTENYFSIEQTQEIIRRYLRGSIEIEHLATQFDCSAQMIEKTLNNNNIAIVSNKLPTGKYFWRKRK